MATAFISYSHEDSNILDRLKVHFKPIEKKYNFLVWDDKRLRAGDKWKVEIEKNLDQADVIVILLSADFLASNFVMDFEYPKALSAAVDRGAKIVVLIVGPCLYDEFDIAEFHFVNDPKETLQDVQADDFSAKHERILVRCVEVVRDYLKEAKDKASKSNKP
ncbi:toll/interleukin-1 receptor domain-containing protein [Bosea sp. (in: a-proteobacteria)]|uniref:toll/interleukin-1 receptor domain-containing protein n=1 Tax=Bosea sp. (in: a-proteobacteria) TaxID=1871050 RepID=UPI0040333C36